MLAEGGETLPKPKVLRVKKGKKASMMKEFLKNQQKHRPNSQLMPIRECGAHLEGGEDGEGSEEAAAENSFSSEEQHTTLLNGVEESDDEDKWQRVSLDIDTVLREQVAKELNFEKQLLKAYKSSSVLASQIKLAVNDELCNKELRDKKQEEAVGRMRKTIEYRLAYKPEMQMVDIID